MRLCSAYGHTTYVNRTISFNGNITIWADNIDIALLRCSVYVKFYIVSRTNNIVLWGSKVHCRFKSQGRVIENIPAEDFVPVKEHFLVLYTRIIGINFLCFLSFLPG